MKLHEEHPIDDRADTSRLLNQTNPPVKAPAVLDAALNWIMGAIITAGVIVAAGAVSHLVHGLFSFGWHLAPTSL